MSSATRQRQALVVTTTVVAVLAAVAVGASTPPEELTLATISFPVQSLISILVPFLGVLAASEWYRSSRPAPLGALLAAPLVLAVAFAGFGFVICALATVVASSAADPWRHVALIFVGSVVVQVVAQLVGTGLGLLIRPPVVAMVATIALPIGLWLLLGATSPAARGWLTPFAAVPSLLAGEMTGLRWAREGVVVLLWGVVLNTAGVLSRLQRVSPGR